MGFIQESLHFGRICGFIRSEAREFMPATPSANELLLAASLLPSLSLALRASDLAKDVCCAGKDSEVGRWRWAGGYVHFRFWLGEGAIDGKADAEEGDPPHD